MISMASMIQNLSAASNESEPKLLLDTVVVLVSIDCDFEPLAVERGLASYVSMDLFADSCGEY
jgi:hypothetical protein